MTGRGRSSGAGASQLGGLQTSPSGCSAFLSMTTVPRAISTPPALMEPSATLMRLPSRVRRTSMAIGASGGRRKRSIVVRAKWKAGSPKRCSTVWASTPARRRPCMELGFQGPRACAVGARRPALRSKKGSFWDSAMVRIEAGRGVRRKAGGGTFNSDCRGLSWVAEGGAGVSQGLRGGETDYAEVRCSDPQNFAPHNLSLNPRHPREIPAARPAHV